MQHRITKLAALSALALATAAAHAAPPTAELKVIGSIDVPGCTVAAPGGDGVYDFDVISPTLIKPGTTHTALTALKKNWVVTCDAETFLTFSVADNRAESVSTPSVANFGLGNVNTTGKIGYYSVMMSAPTVDGVTSTVFYTNTGLPANGGATTSLYSGAYKMGWSTGTTTSTALKSGRVFAADLEVRPQLGGTTTMGGTVKDDVTLDGSLTMNFAFGL
nr:hypothetical protein [uncultured Ralstonia sp.]